MSTDAEYILDYYCNGYLEPTPMQRDKEYLESNYGGRVEFIASSISYWQKPKYCLDEEDFKKLLADRILEKRDCELFERKL